MAAITVRNLSDATHRALKARAAAHGRSTEAEVRSILEQAVAAPKRLRLGSLLDQIGREAGGVELDTSRDRADRNPINLS